MPKQSLPINFSQGLDTKTDPFQIPIGKFSQLTNSVFNKGGLLEKRNGFGSLASLPDSNSILATTFNEDLTTIGQTLQAYSAASQTWSNKGYIQSIGVDTLPLIRNSVNQTQSDSVTASNGLVCTAYTETNGTTVSYKYAIADATTGQNIIAPTAISTADATYGTPKVYILGNYFVIIYTNKVSSTYHLKFFTISINNPSVVTSPVDVSTSYTPATTLNFDAAALNGSLFVAWNGAASSGVKMAFIGANLSVSSTVIVDAAHEATLMSVCTDLNTQIVRVTYYDSVTNNGYTLAVTPQLGLLSGFPVKWINVATPAVTNVTSLASSGVVSIIFEIADTLPYDASIKSHTIDKTAFDESASPIGSTVSIVRSVGLASKPFIVDGVIYFLAVYSSPYQNTCFLINISGNIIAKIAYGNGGGYLTTGLPSASVNGDTATISYLIKDSIQAVNKNTNVPAGSQVNGIYSQTGINQSSFTFGLSQIPTAEIGSNLNISGGITWAYDGYAAVEQGFFLYPDSVEVTTATGSGSIAASTYFYQVTYEWSDNQGNIFRSAPSIPVSIVTTTASSTNTIHVPTLRLTYKTANPVKIVVYRWSTAQQSYYQVTSISTPTLNDTSVDAVTITDTFSDATILGNNLLYTTGGVVENIAPPASSSVTLFDDRLWLIDAEDKNLLWYSKQVIESTPVEMSDLLTVYVAPTLSAQGSTGDMKCLAAMDDKLIIFKKNAIYYINGTGPDNTGANNHYSQPIFITSTVGCSNQSSIVFIPSGLMFQSDKGIWLLGRDLSTQYIGASVEQFNTDLVKSALNIPGTNQVRFTLDSGTTLMYDYFFNQWGTFTDVPAISSTLYQDMHTYIDSRGRVFQETPGVYLDGSQPVLISFTTGWINFAGLRGYERIYSFSFLGTYHSPHKLAIGVGYDYGSVYHQSIYSPDNFSPVYGGLSLYGGPSTYGGPSNIESFEVHAKRQKCLSFQVSVQEIYDPSFGVQAGAGLSLSGMNFEVSLKKQWAPTPGKNSIG